MLACWLQRSRTVENRIRNQRASRFTRGAYLSCFNKGLVQLVQIQRSDRQVSKRRDSTQSLALNSTRRVPASTSHRKAIDFWVLSKVSIHFSLVDALGCAWQNSRIGFCGHVWTWIAAVFHGLSETSTRLLVSLGYNVFCLKIREKTPDESNRIFDLQSFQTSSVFCL